MTNKEFYSDKLLAIAICGKSKYQSLHELVFNKSCQGKDCYDCECYTVKNVENWLNAEHEEPEQPCHVTHWMPMPQPPSKAELERVAKQ